MQLRQKVNLDKKNCLRVHKLLTSPEEHRELKDPIDPLKIEE